MKNASRTCSLAVILVAGVLAVATGEAREPYTPAELADQQAKLLALVDRGRDLWHGSKPEMSSNGLGCGNCHPDAAASNPQTFPKWMPQFNKVVPFREMATPATSPPLPGPFAMVVSEPSLRTRESVEVPPSATSSRSPRTARL